MTSTDQNSSNALFTSSPFDGIKGQRWHQFVQAFKAGADAEFCHEDDDSIWEACIDIDTGGNGTGATPMPTAAAALEKAERKRKKRQAVQQFGNVLPMTKKAKGGDKKKRPMAR